MATAAELGLSAIGITDHDGMYGVVRFAQAARTYGIPAVFGAELSLGVPGRQNGVADPVGAHLVVLARHAEGYRRLSRSISSALLAGGEKGKPIYHLEGLSAAAGGEWLVLTGCRKGPLRQAIATASTAAGAFDAAVGALRRLVDLFGRDQVVAELTRYGGPSDDENNDLIAAAAAAVGVATVATGNVHHATPAQRRLADVVAAVRARRSLDQMDGWLPAAGYRFLRSGEEMAALFARYPGAVARAAAIGRECAFDLTLVKPELPPRTVPAGHTETSWLRALTFAGARDRYGGRAHEAQALAKLDYELGVIAELRFEGYFLIVHEIVEFCRDHGILCQGRGSAANSAVCYALGITSADAVAHGLLFERFLAPDRDGYPDIDLDIQSDRREDVIQHVYDTYGRQNAAMVANVITYRPKNAVRDVAKALGYSTGQQDAWSKHIDRWDTLSPDDDHDIPTPVITLANQLLGFPRHLGIHSGGVVLADRPVSEVVPIEWATMPGRTVVQWDKDDCADSRLVKFDLLGLGMLTALADTIRLVRHHHGRSIDLADLDEADPAVYDMLCRADAIGVFQVESRAQLATLPRLKPRCFYDLVVEVALIRPGPIQGGSVHPYLRRRNGHEPVTYPHPALKPVLERTLGIPLFQEQLMQMAITIANFSPADADRLRRAMGSKRSDARMEELRQQLYDGMATNGITGDLADDLYRKLKAFADFGFPESHSFSFAKIVYASAWFKLYYPAAFCAALLNAQPMGFYAPNTLIADARRHHVAVRGPDINHSRATTSLEPDPHPDPPTQHGERMDHGTLIRLGLATVRTIGDDLAHRIHTERDQHGPYATITDLTRRVGLTVAHTEALATAGAFQCFGLTRREALWIAGAAAGERSDRLPDTSTTTSPPPLPGMTDAEETMADLWATGISTNTHPVHYLRPDLNHRGIVPASALTDIDNGTLVRVAGHVTHRQRPATAGGVTFLNLEDETGMINVICSPGLWTRYRRVARTSPGLIVRAKLEKSHGVINLIAIRLEPLSTRMSLPSRDFH